MLSQPLTVCTVDQLFRFVYRALGTEIFAATLKYSKLVLDEIQAYEPRVIATIIYGLKMIQKWVANLQLLQQLFHLYLNILWNNMVWLRENNTYLKISPEKNIRWRNIQDIKLKSDIRK